jgi:hypothetical protein
MKKPKSTKKPDKPPGKPDGPPGQQPPQSGMDSLTAQSHHCGSPFIQVPTFSIVGVPVGPSLITAQSLVVGSPYFTTPDFYIDAVPPEVPPGELIELTATPLDCASATLKLSAFATFGGPADAHAASLVTAPPYHSTPDFDISRSRTWFGSYRQ